MIDVSHFTPLGNVRAIRQTERGLLLHVGEEQFRVDVIREDVLRLMISQGHRFDEKPTHAANFEMPPVPKFDVRQTSDKVTLTTKRVRLEIQRQPFKLSAYRVTDGTTIFEDYVDSNGDPAGYLCLNNEFVVSRRIGRHDGIYGLGEKTGALDRRGRDFILWNTDILAENVLQLNNLYDADTDLEGESTEFDPYYTSIPFFYHCQTDTSPVNMAGFFIDNGYKADFEFHEHDVYRYKFSGGQYTEYVFAGPSMPEILEAYTFITGRIGAPPLWALGLHQCRFHDYNQESILKIGDEYRSREIPCDVLWLDIDYMNGFRVFTWDCKKFGDVAGMVNQMRENKLRLITIIDPGVKLEAGNPVFEEGLARNFFCKTDAGKPYVGEVWPGRTVFPDFSRQEVRDWWGDLNARHVSTGISGIWIDMNEPATGGVEPFSMRFDRDGENHPHERYHNQYALLMAMGTHQGLRSARPDERPFILSRAGFSGIQRYAAQWTGDNQSRWDHLSLSLPMSMGMGISGQAFIGSDIPGFCGKPGAELSARWAQYGALTPFCRYHNHAGEADQYPWSFGNGVESRSRTAIRLRYQLLPYIYSAFMRTHETGEPIQRPLVYDFQQDRQARETEDCYLFGSSLLVAPVLEVGRTARNVYLPDGTWIDWYSGETHEGGQFITASAPLDVIPLFGRGGYVVPAYPDPPMSTMGYFPEALDLHVFIPLEDGQTTSYLHEDDGHSYSFEQGKFVRTKLDLTREGNTVRLSASVAGEGFVEHRRTSFRCIVHGADVLPKAELDGQVVEFPDDGLIFENRGDAFSLSFELAPAQPKKGGTHSRRNHSPRHGAS